jgi:hypothetical protein
MISKQNTYGGSPIDIGKVNLKIEPMIASAYKEEDIVLEVVFNSIGKKIVYKFDDGPYSPYENPKKALFYDEFQDEPWVNDPVTIEGYAAHILGSNLLHRIIEDTEAMSPAQHSINNFMAIISVDSPNFADYGLRTFGAEYDNLSDVDYLPKSTFCRKRVHEALANEFPSDTQFEFIDGRHFHSYWSDEIRNNYVIVVDIETSSCNRNITIVVAKLI